MTNAIPNFVLCNTSEVSKSINPKFCIRQYLREKISSKFCAMDICFQFDHAVMFSGDAVYVCVCVCVCMCNQKERHGVHGDGMNCCRAKHPSTQATKLNSPGSPIKPNSAQETIFA